jgi:hypothetical protein
MRNNHKEGIIKLKIISIYSRWSRDNYFCVETVRYKLLKWRFCSLKLN